MKKFTEAVNIVRELNEKELSELQKSYREYFGAKMKKFDVSSPAELTDDQKKEFFNEITKDWEKGKGATDAGKKDVEEHGVKESEEIAESFEINEGEINYKTDKYALVLVGGSIGSKQSYPLFVSGSMGSIIETSNDKDALVETKKRMNKQLSPGEKSYYRMSYKVVELTSNKIKEIDMLISKQSSSEDTIIEESEEITESKINEKDIKSAAEFKDFAEAKLKKVFGDDYDEVKAKKTIDGLSAEAEKSGDWGAAIGKLNKA